MCSSDLTAALDQAVVEDTVPLEEEGDEEDVEPDLEALLIGLLASDGAGQDDESEGAAVGEDVDYVPTARRNEFVCTGCFLIWNRRHLADTDRRLCRDCVEDSVTVMARALVKARPSAR